MAEDKGCCGCGESGKHEQERKTDMRNKDIERRDSGSMRVEDAGRKGGERERELVDEGKQEESRR